jgi:hypothetical protein
MGGGPKPGNKALKSGQYEEVGLHGGGTAYDMTTEDFSSPESLKEVLRIIYDDLRDDASKVVWEFKRCFLDSNRPGD